MSNGNTGKKTMTKTDDKSTGSLLVWIDVETTGLGGPTVEELLEVGVMITNQWGDFIDATSWLTVFKKSPIYAEGMDPVVVQMHSDNGLLDEYNQAVADKKFSSALEVEREMIQFLGEYVNPEDEKPPMCGGNVANFDRPYIQVYFPEFNSKLHYRNIDVSTIKELCRRLNPKVLAARPRPELQHRVLKDLEGSVAEYQHYLDNFLFVEDTADKAVV